MAAAATPAAPAGRAHAYTQLFVSVGGERADGWGAGCAVQYGGGAIYAESCSVTVEGSWFKGNSAGQVSAPRPLLPPSLPGLLRVCSVQQGGGPCMTVMWCPVLLYL